MNNRAGAESNHQGDDYHANVFRLAACGAAMNGMMLGVTAGLAFTFLQSIFRRSGANVIRPMSFVTRPLVLGSVCAATGYVATFTGNSVLTFFVKRRAREQVQQMQANKNDQDKDLQTSRVNQHN